MKNKIKEALSDLQINALEKLADEISSELKNKGLMSPEICQVAFSILDKHLEQADRQLKMYEDLVKVKKDAEDYLKKLQDNKK